MKAKLAVSLLTIYLLVYVGLFAAGASITLLAWMFVVSPFLLVGTVYIVLKDNAEHYPQLPEGEEWGYRDKSKDELGLF
jgi:hypothetical protein